MGENFTISILEFTEESELDRRENFYLDKYIPALNTIFRSSGSVVGPKEISEQILYKNMYKIFLSQKQNIKEDITGAGLGIWVYKYLDSHIEKAFEKYPSMLSTSFFKTCKSTGRDRGMIRKFLNTNIPIRGLLFYSSPVLDFYRAFLLSKESLNDFPVKIDPSLSKKEFIL